MATTGHFAVYFRAGRCDLHAAARSLVRHGLTVTPHGDRLVAEWPGSLRFHIGISAEPHVAVEAAEIGEGTSHATTLRGCTARFEIDFDDLAVALDEINTMIEVQTALQEASDGILFLGWNGNLLGPGTGNQG